MAAPTFQQLIQTLNSYWADQGCVLIQPLDLEVGAGTFHPATFLRALGPEPWNAAYVQPSRPAAPRAASIVAPAKDGEKWPTRRKGLPSVSRT